MFGIGLPELILIMGIALIVVGPEKLPELARGLAKQAIELKKAANAFKESLNDEIGDVKPWEQDLPEGFSRPEDLAAAGRDALERNKDREQELSEESPDKSENVPDAEALAVNDETDVVGENDAGKDVNG